MYNFSFDFIITQTLTILRGEHQVVSSTLHQEILLLTGKGNKSWWGKGKNKTEQTKYDTSDHKLSSKCDPISNTFTKETAFSPC